MRLRDRSDAGQRLADVLQSYVSQDDVIVIALPRGGVPVAFEIAQRLRAPLDVRLVRKIGAPDQPEYAIGAIATGGIEFLNRDSIRKLRLTADQLAQLVERERIELARCEAELRAGHPRLGVSGKRAIVVDDGLATGSTMRAALTVLRAEGASRIVMAVPVGALSAMRLLEGDADEMICLFALQHFDAVSQWYDDFTQVSDEQVRSLLSRSRHGTAL